MKSFLLVFLGGGLGSAVRFYIGKGVNLFHSQNFPWGTLVVNVVACFILGTVVGLADHKQLISSQARLFWAVGFCGGFSTFSSFSYETLQLLQSGLNTSSTMYVAGSIVLCIGATVAGLYLGEQF